MDKLRSILSSASGRKVGPPVPPRPPKTAVQKALEKTRNQFPPPPVPIAKGRTVIYTSTDNNNSQSFDTKLHESSTHSSPSTGLKATQNGNAARAVNKESSTPLMHYKSPVPRPRLKTPPSPPSTLPNINTRNYQSHTTTKKLSTDYGYKKSRDDELKEKLLNEIFSGRLVEAANVHLRYNGSNLKRSSSCDVLNDRNSIIEMSPPTPQEKSSDHKVAFHEILISELSEMRRETHRLSAAKSCSDLSPSGPKQVFTLVDIGRNEICNNSCLISLEDSGVEDEEKPDDCSSSGVGDSWDSCKEMQNRWVFQLFPKFKKLLN